MSDALASDEDEIDEDGQQYLEKLEKSVSIKLASYLMEGWWLYPVLHLWPSSTVKAGFRYL